MNKENVIGFCELLCTRASTIPIKLFTGAARHHNLICSIIVKHLRTVRDKQMTRISAGTLGGTVTPGIEVMVAGSALVRWTVAAQLTKPERESFYENPSKQPFKLAREASAHKTITQFVCWKDRWWTVNHSNVTPAKIKEAAVSKLSPRKPEQILQQPECVFSCHFKAFPGLE